MKQRIVIKMCGRDQDGNTGPVDVQGKRLENVFPDDGVGVFYPKASGMNERRKMDFCPETGEPVFEKTMNEAIDEMAKSIAGDRPYFICLESDLPKYPHYRDSWRFRDNHVEVDIEMAKAIHKAMLQHKARAKLKVLDDPLSTVPDREKKKEKIIKAFQELDLSGVSTMDDLVKMVPNILKD